MTNHSRWSSQTVPNSIQLADAIKITKLEDIENEDLLKGYVKATLNVPWQFKRKHYLQKEARKPCPNLWADKYPSHFPIPGDLFQPLFQGAESGVLESWTLEGPNQVVIQVLGVYFSDDSSPEAKRKRKEDDKCEIKASVFFPFKTKFLSCFDRVRQKISHHYFNTELFDI